MVIRNFKTNLGVTGDLKLRAERDRWKSLATRMEIWIKSVATTLTMRGALMMEQYELRRKIEEAQKLLTDLKEMEE